MSKALHVTIATVSETLYNGVADALIVPGSAGEMTILADHEPLITTLKNGSVTVKAGGEIHAFPVRQGVLEVSKSTASVLL